MYLEAAWAAEEFNKFTSNPIDIPYSTSLIEEFVTENLTEVSFEAFESAVLYENITVKEQSEKAARACFNDNKPGSSIDIKRQEIEAELANINLELTLNIQNVAA